MGGFHPWPFRSSIRIPPRDFTENKQPATRRMANAWTFTSYWVSKTIVEEPRLQRRVGILSKFIEVAETLQVGHRGAVGWRMAG